MAPRISLGLSALLTLGLVLIILPGQAHAFGAGNIASISKVEGKNWRHGDIEDMLKTIAFIKGQKWTSNMVKRVYFGNWLRDYSQAMDVGTLKSLPADTIRILVWILSFLTFGYATAEFEVTAERLGVYRPEEHIDNPKDYADNLDARKYDARLRGPIRQVELDIDPQTGMKNYIANERGDWATSAAYIKYSLARSIHFGRMYTSGGQRKGNEEDLFEALRCLGQGLHTLEDFAAHTNYIELSLREMGFRNVFPHTGSRTEINLHGHRVYPLVTGTFGMVDFFHSVLGEATDHFTQSEINEMDTALCDAQSNSSSNSLNALTGLLGKVPGCGDLVAEAQALKRRSEAQASSNKYNGAHAGYAAREITRAFNGDESERSRSRGPGDHQNMGARISNDNKPSSDMAANFDPAKTIAQIYPILEFRDKVVRKISSIIEKIPGLESLVEKISETVTVFVMSLLAPFIRPIINLASKSLQDGSAGVIDASGKHQFEPWTNPSCTDPTHSMLSKDHFTNILNEPAGHVASAILKYVTPRVLHAWQDISIPEQRVLDDCLQVFHHPALRNMHNEAHRTMFEAVQSWVHAMPDRGAKLNNILSSDGVKSGKNNGGSTSHTHSHGGFPALGGAANTNHGHGSSSQQGHYQQSSHFTSNSPHQQQQQQQHQGGSGLPWEKLSGQLNNINIPGIGGLGKLNSAFSGLGLGGSSRDQDNTSSAYQPPAHHQDQQPHQYPPSSHPPGSGYGDYHAPHPPGYDQGYGQHHPPPPPHEQQQPYGYSNTSSYNHPQGGGYGHGHGHGYGHGY